MTRFLRHCTVSVVLICAPLIWAHGAVAQEAARPRDGTSAAAPQRREVPQGSVEERFLALGEELLRLNDRLAALERMTVQVLSRQEEDSRSLSQLRDEIARNRSVVERQLADLAASGFPTERRASSGAPSFAASSTIATADTETTPSASAIDRFEQGKAFAIAKEWSRAELALTTFISNNPGDARIPEARYRLGLAYLEQGQAAQGARIFIDLFDTDTSVGFEPDNLFALARALREMKDVDPIQVCSVYTEIEVAHGAKLPRARREELLDLRLAADCDA